MAFLVVAKWRRAPAARIKHGQKAASEMAVGRGQESQTVIHRFGGKHSTAVVPPNRGLHFKLQFSLI
jgi:hypothetical protein